MMRLYLFRAYHPALVVYSYGINTEKIKEWYSEHPAVFIEITRWQHGKRHLDISQYIKPYHAVAVRIRVKDNGTRISRIVPNSVPVTDH